ncbi:MAG: hypothetical protein RSC74_00005, partial [Hydrogenoanaerobacterium sp.]
HNETRKNENRGCIVFLMATWMGSTRAVENLPQAAFLSLNLRLAALFSSTAVRSPSLGLHSIF